MHHSEFYDFVLPQENPWYSVWRAEGESVASVSNPSKSAEFSNKAGVGFAD